MRSLETAIDLIPSERNKMTEVLLRWVRRIDLVSSN